MRESFYILFPIPTSPPPPYGGAVQADGITSANTVGYTSQEVKAGQFYMVGVQFADVKATDTVDLNTLLSTTCAPGEIGDGEDDTWGNAPMIQVLKANGKNYSYYYYISDADDGSETWDKTGWADDQGLLVTTADALALSKGFWFKSMSAGMLNCAGQVFAITEFERTIPGGQFEIVANPYPVALNLNAFKTSVISPGEIGDGEDDTWGNAPMIQVLKENGKNYSYYYYISDADDGSDTWDKTGWADDQGYLTVGAQVPVGAAFWIKSTTTGTFTFAL